MGRPTPPHPFTPNPPPRRRHQTCAECRARASALLRASAPTADDTRGAGAGRVPAGSSGSSEVRAWPGRVRGVAPFLPVRVTPTPALARWTPNLACGRPPAGPGRGERVPRGFKLC